MLEGALASCACLWLLALFQRRFNRQGGLARNLGGAAYGAFLLHPPVIVGLALAVNGLAIASEIRFAIVLGAGIWASFGLAMLGVRVWSSWRQARDLSQQGPALVDAVARL